MCNDPHPARHRAGTILIVRGTAHKRRGSVLRSSDPADHSGGATCNYDFRSQAIAYQCTSWRYRCCTGGYHRLTRRTVSHRTGTSAHLTQLELQRRRPTRNRRGVAAPQERPLVHRPVPARTVAVAANLGAATASNAGSTIANGRGTVTNGRYRCTMRQSRITPTWNHLIRTAYRQSLGGSRSVIGFYATLLRTHVI